MSQTFAEQIYYRVGQSFQMIDDIGSLVTLTCVEGEGCTDCEFKRAAGKPQHPFCKAVACGEYERIDDKSVIFEQQKVKGGGEQ